MAKKSLLLLAGILVALIVVEITVRGLGVAPDLAILDTGRFRLSDSPLIGYEPIPGYEYRAQRKTFRGRGNALGFRDRDHDREKPPETLRIAVLGDSIAAGLKIEQLTDVFPSVLEQELNENGLTAEVINFAVNGYNTMQEVATLERHGLDYRPDLVLVAYCLNDIERSDGQLLDSLLSVEAGQPSGTSPWMRRALVKSAFYRYLNYVVLAPRRRPPLELAAKYAPLYQNTVVESLRQLANLSAQHDFDVLLVVFPYLKDVIDYDPQLVYAHAGVSDLARSLGFEVFDLLDTFRECGEPPGSGIAYDVLHPNETGHRCAAESASRFIQRGHGEGLFRIR